MSFAVRWNQETKPQFKRDERRRVLLTWGQIFAYSKTRNQRGRDAGVKDEVFPAGSCVKTGLLLVALFGKILETFR